MFLFVKWSQLAMLCNVRKCRKCGKVRDRKYKFYLNNPMLSVVREKDLFISLIFGNKNKNLCKN